METEKEKQRYFSRREFLWISGQAGLGAVMLSLGESVLAPGRAGAIDNRGGGLREFHLEAREIMWELAPGKRIKAMAYNGQVPGPEIRVREGDKVRVVLKNSLSEPTTIHWHGVDVPNPMDGVPGITQKPVQPGETFIYEFNARPAGTRWYHTHFQEHKQLDLGLYAPLIIEPTQPDPFSFDREYSLLLDDWAVGSGRPVPSTHEGTAGVRGGMGHMMGDMMGGDHTHAYDTMTINGKAHPATQPLKVRKGERVRLRFINASAEHTHVVQLAGHKLHVIYTDGNPLVQPVEVDAVPLAPSERCDAFFYAKNAGVWSLTCRQPGHSGAGEEVHVVYEGREGDRPVGLQTESREPTLWHNALGRGRDVLPRSMGGERSFDLILSGGMMGSDIWTINGKRYPDTDPLRLRKGDRVRVRLTNQSPEAHPMHLHGQSFKVLAINGSRLSTPIVKDTVDVEPHIGSVVVEFTAHNPGDWFFHCHKPMHMEGGMITLAKIV